MIKEITYLKNKEIDKSKWDEVVAKAPNGFLYARSFFLDALCDWDALVSENYAYIMPLPFKSKLGISYIYTPYFIGQLGIISKDEISPAIVSRFLQAIPSSFRYIDLQLNEANPVNDNEKTNLQLRVNYVLPLQLPYHLLEKNFSKDAKKNLRRADEHALIVENNIEPAIVIQYFKQAYGKLNTGISEADYVNFQQACNAAIQRGLGFTMGIKDKNGELVAVAFFGKDEKRIYYMMGAPSASGRNSNAQHALINEIIKKFAGTSLSLDFEGSDIPSVATFYKKFNPVKNQYPHIRINRLPAALKWLKK